MPPARPDIIAEGKHDVPFREKRACSGCRAIKSRCMIQDDSPSCSRCTRLGIECNFLEHHRGVKSKVIKDEGVRRGHAAKNSISNKRSPTSSSSRSPKRHTSYALAEAQPFSIQSMLSVDTASNPSHSTLLSSTTFSNMQEDESGPSSGIAKKPSVSHESVDESQFIVEHILSTDIITRDQAVDLITFFYFKLNPIIALLDPQLYSIDTLLSDDRHRLLLASLCTVSAKFCMPDTYLRLLSFLEAPLARISSQDIAPKHDYVLSLSILAMWKHPQDGTSWRKLRLAVTMALELGLQHTFNEVFASSARSSGPRKKPPPRDFVQRQRTFLQLACFEDGYQDQRRIPMAINRSLLPEPWQWIEWLGEQVQDIDIRLAASRENALVKQNLMRNLKRDAGIGQGNGGSIKGALTKAIAVRRIQEIEMAIAAERANTRIWKQPSEYGLGSGRMHSGRPCLLFHTANTMFNYHRALYSVYCSSVMKDLDPARKQSVFLDCCRLSVELFELIGGPYGEQDYFRFVHDIVIMNLAVAAVWISDNWRHMPADLALQAALAVTTAANTTASCLDRNLEQASYLAKFLAYCSEKINLLQNSNGYVNGHQGPIAQSDNNSVLQANGAGMQHLLFDSKPIQSPSGPMVIGNGRMQAAATSVSPESLTLFDMYGNSGDPSLQYLQDLLSVPCVQMDEADGHNILSFFYDERKRQT